MKECISCGMPMEKTTDFPMNDVTKDYCIYCARADGSMKSYEEALEDGARFLMAEEGVDYETAKARNALYLKTMPAWKDR